MDESKIQRTADFYAALDKVLAAIGPARDRVQVFISSRISEWQPVTDRQEVLSRFRSEAAEENDLLVVEIEPLDRERVRAFAHNRGITNPDTFLAELDNSFAWEFARRPLDVLDLAEFWMANHRLGTLTEIIEFDVTAKLKESADRQSQFPLSESRAREGAEALAVATVLCMRQQFKVPDDSYKAADALDAAACLPDDWKPGEVKALLSRPLFDSATYGQIRFHHRRIAEYLAAAWFRRRMATGCPTHALIQQLFQEVRGVLVPRRSLIPVIAWLSAGTDRWNDEVRAWVLETAPAIHLEHGDAQHLSVEFRRNLLSAWIERNKDREDVWDRYTPEALRRLGHVELESEVNRLLARGVTKRRARQLLVHLVRFGRLEGCLPRMVEMLASPAESDDAKIYALAAIRDMGTAPSCEQAWDIIRVMPDFPRSMCSVAAEALYPRTIGATDLAALLEKPCRESESRSNLGYALKTLLEEELTPALAASLLVPFNRLIQLAPHVFMSDKETRISARFRFLLGLMPLALTRALSEPSPSDELRAAAAESLSLLAEADPFLDKPVAHHDSLDAVCKAHPGIRRCFFWRTLERLRGENGATPEPWPLMHEFREVMEPSDCDVEWMIEDIRTLENQDDRRLLFRIALTHKADRHLPILERAVANSPELSGMLRENRTAKKWGWFRRLRYRISNTIGSKFWWFNRKHSAKRRWNTLVTEWQLLRYRGRIRRGEALGMLDRLRHEAARDGSKCAPESWNSFALKRGARLTAAVQAGCKRRWRGYTPPLPHMNGHADADWSGIGVGLAGAQLAYEDGELNWNTISDADARLLTRYAVNELNGFPMWFGELVAARPIPVGEVLRECVTAELQYPADRQRHHDVLAKLAWEGRELARFVRPNVIEALHAGDPAHPEICSAAITLALKTTTLPDADLAEIAAARCRSLPLDSDAFPRWMAVCLQVNADTAITVFEEKLPTATNADAVVLGVCDMIGDGIRRNFLLIANPDLHRPAALVRLIPIIYRHIRPAEDSDHADGEPYSANARDDAATFRGGLLTRLANSEDPSAMDALRTLAEHSEMVTVRDWILRLIDERTITEADHRPWKPGDIRIFAQEHETAPRTDAELYRIVCNRLTDIKFDVERSDNSLREEIRPKSSEAVLRRWLARKLAERANKRYTIPQETEIDQEQRPDLRAENPATDPVSLELKWADNWTLPVLLERLENQLLGQYLRAHNSRFGIYALGTDGRKKNWKDADGKDITFAEVLAAVTNRARELARTRGDVDGVSVFGIDFRSPT